MISLGDWKLVFLCASLVISLAIYWQQKPDKYENDQDMNLVVKTKCGPVEGVIEESTRGEKTYVFKGIPYAKPPNGKRRWKAPETLEFGEDGQCWKGIFKAHEFGSQCPQIIPILGPQVLGNEDCLYLNVLVPQRKDTSALPVLVFIHGGGFIFGSGNDTGLVPNADFVNSVGVIAVTFNYRLGGIGFLSHDVLSRSSLTKSSGNYGFMDQILCLEWVKENIEYFGGDPGQITLGGHSAGGTSVQALLASPLATGLFHRAIVMSAAVGFATTRHDASKEHDRFLQKSGCMKENDEDILACLYNLTSDEVTKLLFPVGMPWDYMRLPTKGVLRNTMTILEPTVLPVSPTKPPGDADIAALKVPVLFTSLTQDTGFLDPIPYTFSEKPRKALVEEINKTLGTFSPHLAREGLSKYEDILGIVDNTFTYITMVTDVRNTCPTHRVAKNFADFNENVYRLILAQGPSKPLTFFGMTSTLAFHAVDVIALFNFHLPGAGKSGPMRLYTPGVLDLKFRDLLLEEFGNFIKYGRPKKNGWTPFPMTTAVYENGTLKVENGIFREKECEFWSKNGLDDYSWAL